MLANNLSVVNFFSWVDKKLAAVLQFVDRVGESGTRFHGNHRTVGAPCNLTLKGLVLFKAVSHDGFALTGGENVGAKADDTTRRHVELDVHTFALRFHRSHFALSACHHVNHFAGELFGNVDG